MKKIVLSVSLVLALCQGRAEITMTNFVTSGPLEEPGFKQALFQAITTGIWGPSTPKPVNNTLSLNQITEPRWLVLGSHAYGNGARFLPVEAIYDHVSTDRNGVLTVEARGEETSFNQFFVGGITNPDGTKTWFTSGSLRPVDEWFSYEGLSLDTSSEWSPFSLNTKISLRGNQGQPFTIGSSTAVEIIPDALNSILTGTNLTLFWPDTATGYRVESALSLLSPITWSNVTGTFQTNSGFINMVLPVTGAQNFYRLARP